MKSSCDCFNQSIKRSSGFLAKVSLQFGDGLLDRIEVRGVWWQVAQAGSGSFDRLPDASDFVTCQIVHDDDVAGL